MNVFNELWTYFGSQEFHDCLEKLYFIAGIVIASGLVIAIRQLRQQKHLSKIRNRRDAFKIAAERCDYFGREIVPMAIALNKAFDDDNITLLKKCQVERTVNGLKLVSNDLTPEDGATANKHSDKMSVFLNSLEGFALFFVTGVADENIGFLSCGRTFVEFFEKYFPLYVLAEALESNAVSTQALYDRWRQRLHQMELVAKKEEIEAELDTSKLKGVRPIGG